MYYNIEDIKAIPIQDICSLYGISLNKKGENWWGRLRSNDKTPSFSVNPSKNIWRDWGMGKGGDTIALVSEIEGVDKGNAIGILGERFGVSPEVNNYQKRYLPTHSQFKEIGIYSKRSIQNLDINLEKQSVEELERLEEKFQVSMQELSNIDKENYHKIIDKKSLPIIYEERQNLIERFNKYISCNTYIDIMIYENIIEKLQFSLNKKIDIYNNARLDGVNLDELKINKLIDIDIEKERIEKINIEKNYLKEKLKVLLVEYEDVNSNKIKELDYVIKIKEKVLEKYKIVERGNITMNDDKKINEKKTDRIKELSEELEDGIKKIFKSDKYKKFLGTMSKFHDYSFRNSLLIMMQNPEATYVAGFNKWNTLNRKVNKGEKGIRIFAPAPIKKMFEQYKKDEKGNFIYENGKKLTEEVEKVIPKYKITHVFDISQTNGEPLPSLTEELKGNVENFINFKKALENSTSFNVYYGEIKGEAKGYCAPTLKRIKVKENMSEIQTVKTLIHEIAHAELHTGKDGKDSATKEVEAESIAYVVSNYYGIDTSDYSFGYLAGWSSDKELVELKGSLDIIQKTAAKLIGEIDRNYKELFNEKDKSNNCKIGIKEIVKDAGKKAEEHNDKLEKKEGKINENEL